MSEKRYLLNPKQGYVVPFTPILKKNCPHFIACDAKGKPTFSDDDDMPFLLNPVTEELVVNKEVNRKPGMVGVASTEHAEQIMAELGKHALKAPLIDPSEPVMAPPGMDAELEDDPDVTDGDEPEETPPKDKTPSMEAINVSRMTRKKMSELAMEVYDHDLDTDLEVAVMREQLSVIINQNPGKGYAVAA